MSIIGSLVWLWSSVLCRVLSCRCITVYAFCRSIRGFSALRRPVGFDDACSFQGSFGTVVVYIRPFLAASGIPALYSSDRSDLFRRIDVGAIPGCRILLVFGCRFLVGLMGAPSVFKEKLQTEFAVGFVALVTSASLWGLGGDMEGMNGVSPYAWEAASVL